MLQLMFLISGGFRIFQGALTPKVGAPTYNLAKLV